MKKKPQSNTAKKKPAPTKDTGAKKQTKEEIEEKERIAEEKVADGEGCLCCFCSCCFKEVIILLYTSYTFFSPARTFLVRTSSMREAKI